MDPELRVKRAGGENRLDHSEIIEDLQRARLDAFAARSLEGRCRGLDQAKRDPAARKIQRERQPRWPGAGDQYRVMFRTSYE